MRSLNTFARWLNRKGRTTARHRGCWQLSSRVQTGITAALARRVRETTQVAVGFGLVGASLGLLPFARARFAVLVMVAVVALGVALITPNLTALITTRGTDRRRARRAEHRQRPRPAGGTVLGGVFLGWNMEAPFR